MKKLILLIILVVPIYFVYSYNSFKSAILTSEEQTLEIKKGDTYRSLANKFDLNANYLKAYLKLNPPSKDLQAGIYKLKKGLNIDGVIESLKNPITNDYYVMFLPGWTIYDIDNCLSNPESTIKEDNEGNLKFCMYKYDTKNNSKIPIKEGLIKSGELISLNKEKLIDFKNDYSFLKQVSTLEGFLYPDTYNINPNNFKLEDFVKTMLENFDKKVIVDLEIDPKDIDLQNNLILASIVQRESNQKDNLEETRIVAGVLKKRMKENWFIGADATVCYPYELTFDECTPKFIVNHIEDKNEYNTRNKLGLPKTPICNPSANSIEAVYNTKNTPYYYYLHDENGQIHYATTNEEHVANKMLYIK